MEKNRWIDNKIGQMNIEQKVGQMMVFGFCGTVITPDVIEMITKYHVGGLRITQGCRVITMAHAVRMGTEPEAWIEREIYYPEGANKDYAHVNGAAKCTAKEYAMVLNRLRDYALDRKSSVGLHFTMDQEGNVAELLSGQRLFPDQMGVAASGNPDLAYRIAKSLAKQVRAVGVNMLHSPVLDVNTNQNNPEIGPRSYGSNPEVVEKFGLEMLRAFNEHSLIATAKHFPGRGESDVDSHFELPVVNINRKTLMDVHIAPYKALIDAGLPSVMIGHSIYPALDSSDVPSSTSERIIQGILREQLNFKGVITTDNIMMAGIMKKYSIQEAVVLAIIAGCDLILFRDESPLRIKIIEHVMDSIKSGRISEKIIDDAVTRILAMRWDMGITGNGGKVDPEMAEEPIQDIQTNKVANEAAEKCTILLRNEQEILPLSTNKRVLLVEQIHTIHSESNNLYSHPGLLWEQMCKYSDNVMSVEIPFFPTEADCERVLKRISEAEVIVMTNYYHQKMGKGITEFIKSILMYRKPVIVVANNPFKFCIADEFESVIVTFCAGGKENLDAVAKAIFGKIKLTAKLPC